MNASTSRARLTTLFNRMLGAPGRHPRGSPAGPYPVCAWPNVPNAVVLWSEGPLPMEPVLDVPLTEQAKYLAIWLAYDALSIAEILWGLHG